MRILIAHSFYRIPGGEDRYVRQQVELLRGRHEVGLLARSNSRLDQGVRTAARMAYSPDLRARAERTIERFHPDVIHLHNPYPSFGPAVHLAAERSGIPLVVTAHNLRLRCPNGIMFTEGGLCRRCEGGAYVNAISHRCFASVSQATAYASVLWIHRFVFGLDRRVAMFIAPSRFMQARLAGWDISRERISLVRNFTDLPTGESTPGEAGVCLGRLSAEKGLDVLLRALRAAGDPPFRVIGEGPALRDLSDLAGRLALRNTSFLGRLDRNAVARELRQARFVAFPSRWDENAPLAALEAMACGRPLLVARTGGLTELVEDGAGLACAVGDVDEMAAGIERLMGDDGLCTACGERGLRLAQSEFAPDRHLDHLETAYERVLGG